MSKLKISNKDQLDKWLNERRSLGRDVVSCKRMVSGEFLNIAWQDCTTKEIFSIEYEQLKE